MRKYGNRFVEMNIEKAETENFIEIIYPNVRTSKFLPKGAPTLRIGGVSEVLGDERTD
jgi:hypothetical protein